MEFLFVVSKREKKKKEFWYDVAKCKQQNLRPTSAVCIHTITNLTSL